MNYAMRLLFCALFCLTLCAQTTYYVDPGHGAADDANPGTDMNKPWMTLRPTVAGMGPTFARGDVIRIKRGTTINTSAGAAFGNTAMGFGHEKLAFDTYGNPSNPLPIIDGGGNNETVGLLLSNVNECEIRNIHFTGCVIGVLLLGTTSNNVIESCDFINNVAETGAGVNGGTGIVASSSGTANKILNNYITGSRGDGITITNDSKNWEIRGNRIISNGLIEYTASGNVIGGDGIAMHGSNDGYIVNNIIDDHYGKGFSATSSGNVWVVNNYIADYMDNGVSSPKLGGELHVIGNVIVISNKTFGVGLPRRHGLAMVPGPNGDEGEGVMYAYNNTIINLCTSAGANSAFGGVEPGTVYLRNNVFYSAGGTAHFFYITTTVTFSDNNIFSDGVSGRFNFAGTPHTFATWGAFLQGLGIGLWGEASSIVGDPMLVDAATPEGMDDARLLPGSPAFGVGVAVALGEDPQKFTDHFTGYWGTSWGLTKDGDRTDNNPIDLGAFRLAPFDSSIIVDTTTPEALVTKSGSVTTLLDSAVTTLDLAEGGKNIQIVGLGSGTTARLSFGFLSNIAVDPIDPATVSNNGPVVGIVNGASTIFKFRQNVTQIKFWTSATGHSAIVNVW